MWNVVLYYVSTVQANVTAAKCVRGKQRSIIDDRFVVAH